MRPRREAVSLAFRVWILATVFVWPFIEGWEIALWAAAGAGMALWWRCLPEDPPPPPPRLPYQHLYEHLGHRASDGPPETSPAGAPEGRNAAHTDRR